MSRTEHELEVEHDDRTYVVTVEVEWRKVDDSFDGHAYGRPYTFEAHHYEPDEWEVYSCAVLTEDDQEDVEPDDVPGLAKAIRWAVEDLEHPDA